MKGFAEIILKEKHGIDLAKKKNDPLKKGWPLIEGLYSQGYLTILDIALAEKILKNYPESDESLALVICHLSLLARQGHLCFSLGLSSIHPSPKSCWITEGGEAVNESTKDDFWNQLDQKILEGIKKFPDSLLSQIKEEKEDGEPLPLTPIYQFQKLIYFQKHFFFESLLLKHYQRLKNFTIPEHLNGYLNEDLNLEKLTATIQEELSKKQILTEQAEAIFKASLTVLFFLCGGPGTGKTYTAGQLIKNWWKALSPIKKKTYKIALAAPTGKAAAHLEKSIKKATRELSDFNIAKASTLHQLLGITATSNKKKIQTLPFDLIIVDESSMIDIRLMAYLFSAIKEGAKLILMGDPYQLPPVESGGVFADLVNEEIKQKEPPNINIHLLKTCLRSELKEIIDFAHLVNSESSQKVLEYLYNANLKKAVFRLTTPKNNHFSIQREQDIIVDYALDTLFAERQKNGKSMQECLETFRILTPLVKGPFGVTEMNIMIAKKFVKKFKDAQDFCLPIMINRNDPKTELFNGDVGFLFCKKSFFEDFARPDFPFLKQGDFGLFISSNGEKQRQIPALLLPHFELAFCVSIHKSQGSEYPHVLVLLPDGSESFGKELLYTAVTRAKEKLCLFGADDVIHKILSKNSVRFSGLSTRLKRV